VIWGGVSASIPSTWSGSCFSKLDSNGALSHERIGRSPAWTDKQPITPSVATSSCFILFPLSNGYSTRTIRVRGSDPVRGQMGPNCPNTFFFSQNFRRSFPLYRAISILGYNFFRRRSPIFPVKAQYQKSQISADNHAHTKSILQR